MAGWEVNLIDISLGAATAAGAAFRRISKNKTPEIRSLEEQLSQARAALKENPHQDQFMGQVAKLKSNLKTAKKENRTIGNTARVVRDATIGGVVGAGASKTTRVGFEHVRNIRKLDEDLWEEVTLSPEEVRKSAACWAAMSRRPLSEEGRKSLSDPHYNLASLFAERARIKNPHQARILSTLYPLAKEKNMAGFIGILKDHGILEGTGTEAAQIQKFQNRYGWVFE